MSFTIPTRSFNPAEVPINIAWMLIGWAVGKGLDNLLKHHPIKMNKETVWRNYQWMKIGIHMISFVVFANLSTLFEKIYIRSLESKCHQTVENHMIDGIGILIKLEPDGMLKMYEDLKKAMTQLQVNKITGIQKELL